MAFNFSIAITSTRGETFKIEGAHSFEEAIKMVERGIYDRELSLQEQQRKEVAKMPAALGGPAPMTPTKPEAEGGAQTAPPSGQSVGSDISVATAPKKE